MSKFEFNELIEVSDFDDFRESEKAHFMIDLDRSDKWSGVNTIVAIAGDGLPRSFGFARKIKKRVRVSFHDIYSVHSATFYDISQELAENLISELKARIREENK